MMNISESGTGNLCFEIDIVKTMAAQCNNSVIKWKTNISTLSERF